jgi:hypothetical protein
MPTSPGGYLAEHLEYLEPTLGLTAMELVETESPVGSFFLDIRASGVDAQGQTVAVPIENQYGRTDHDHLGKLITYTAQALAFTQSLGATMGVYEHVLRLDLVSVLIYRRRRDRLESTPNLSQGLSPSSGAKW